MTLKLILTSMRPRQWTKNILLLAGLFFSGRMMEPVSVERALAGFVLFCMLSGAIYLLNDVIDYPRDRLHPRKRRRPIAADLLPVGVAIVAAALIGVLALGLSFWLSRFFGMCAVAYLFMMVWYTLLLKDVFLIDTLIVAIGFMIRAVAGVIVLRTPTTAVPLTSWFVVCVMFLSLLLAFCKRRGERLALADDAPAFRPVLQLYSLELLDKAITLCAGGAILTYALYASASTNPWMMLSTLPFVLFGIFRYLHLVYDRREGEAPESTLTSDWPLLSCVIMWGLVLVIVYLPSK